LEGGDESSSKDSELSWYSRTHKKVREIHTPLIDDLGGDGKFWCVLTTSFVTILLLYLKAGPG